MPCLTRGIPWLLLMVAAMAGADVPTGLDLKLLKTLTTSLDNNQAISPFVVSSLISQLWLGATGTTRSQMSQALGLVGSSPLAIAREFLPAYKSAISQLSASNGTVTTAVFNRIYVRKGFSINRTFTRLLEIVYGSGVRRISSASLAAAEINTDVAKVTRNCITNLVSASALERVAMVLVSALYFKGLWLHTFDRPVSESFLTASGERQVDMMKLQKSLRYDRMLTYDALELPYKGEDNCMLLLRPLERSMAAVEKLRDSLDSLNVADILGRLRSREVRVSMPSFTMDVTYNLRKAMSVLGMTRLFSSQAEFRGISRFPWSVSDIYHKVFIKVTPNGTEAAGAAITLFFFTSATPQPISFKLDRPFFAVLYNKKHKINMFSAYVAEP